MPDAEHSMAGHEVDLVVSIATFAARIVNNEPMPVYSWYALVSVTCAVCVLRSRPQDQHYYR